MKLQQQVFGNCYTLFQHLTEDRCYMHTTRLLHGFPKQFRDDEIFKCN
jgi:hypothetical protein